jgi:hypothetical protein
VTPRSIEESNRLIDYLDDQVSSYGGIPASRSNPNYPDIKLIAGAAIVPKWKISTAKGPLRPILMGYVSRHELRVHEGAAGKTFENADAMHDRVVQYVHDRIARRLGLPAIAGRPNMRAIARGANVGVKTLIVKEHRSRAVVMEAFKAIGVGPERPRGEMSIGDFLNILEGACNV